MPEHPKDPESRIEFFVDECRRLGLKLTHQRLEIFRVLASGKGHPSAEEIYKELARTMPTLSLDTVYRSLLTFERRGLIRRVEVLDDRARFDANLNDHHHMVCKRCRKAIDFDWPSLDDIDLPAGTEGWGDIESLHVELRGICKRCREAD